MSLVGPQSLHSSEHPVVVLSLLGLCHMAGGPSLVPGVPLPPLPGADLGVSLKITISSQRSLPSLTYLLGFIQSVSLVDIVLAVDDPEYLVVRVDDAACVVSLLPGTEDGGV